MESIIIKDKSKNVNINITLETITCIIGSNGSGKSLMLDNIYKTIKNDDKTVYYLSQSLDDEVYSVTILDDLKSLFNKEIKDSNNVLKYISNALKLVGLDRCYLEMDPIELNEIELQKFNLAKMFLSNCDILLLDEPTLLLNSSDKNNFIKIIKKFKRNYHKTIVIATNDIELVNMIGDNIIIINGKEIIQDEKNELFKDINIFNNNKINLPNIIKFSELAHEEKGIQYRPRNDINDLIKDILRSIDLSSKGDPK